MTGQAARLGVAIAGCGRVAEVGYLPALEASSACQLVGLADPDLDRCARLAPSVPAYATLEALLGSTLPDLVVVAAPVSAHVPLARLAVAAGVPTLVEKPPAPTFELAAELMALHRSVYIGFNRRFDPALVALRERVAHDARGELRLELAISISPRDWGSYVAADDPLLDLGPHLADLAVWISGQRPVYARFVSESSRGERFETQWDGGSAVVDVSHAGGWRERVEARDERKRLGRVALGGALNRLSRRVRRTGSPLVATLGAQLAALGMELGGAPDARLARADDGVVAMGILDAVKRSRRAGGSWVGVPLPGDSLTR